RLARTEVSDAFLTRIRSARSTWVNPSSCHSLRSRAHSATLTPCGRSLSARVATKARWACRTRKLRLRSVNACGCWWIDPERRRAGANLVAVDGMRRPREVRWHCLAKYRMGPYYPAQEQADRRERGRHAT